MATSTIISAKAMLLVIIGAIILILLYVFFGFGYIETKGTLNNGLIFVGEAAYSLDQEQFVRLRPGRYVVAEFAPEYELSKTITVLPFINHTIKVTAQKRDFAKTIKQVGELSFNTQDITPSGGKIIDVVWYACVLRTPNSTDYFVMRYSGGDWHKAYEGFSNDSDFNQLPQSIQKYLISINGNRVHSDGR